MVKTTYERAAVYDFMVRYCVSTGGLPPTRQEIAEHLGTSSKSTVNYILRDLADLGLVKFGRAGVAQVVGGKWTPMNKVAWDGSGGIKFVEMRIERR